MLLSKQEDCMKKIRDLGSLPSDAFDTCMRENMKQLRPMLHNCNQQLQEFSHVNKEALNQYMNFTEQREQLQKRRAELDAGDQKIKELVSDLDHWKDESIEHTFKGVARHFRQVFSELVQGGVGRLGTYTIMYPEHQMTTTVDPTTTVTAVTIPTSITKSSTIISTRGTIFTSLSAISTTLTVSTNARRRCVSFRLATTTSEFWLKQRR